MNRNYLITSDDIFKVKDSSFRHAAGIFTAMLEDQLSSPLIARVAQRAFVKLNYKSNPNTKKPTSYLRMSALLFGIYAKYL